MYLATMLDTHALVSGVLRIIQPKLYDTGKDAIVKITQADADKRPVFDLWGNPFSAGSVISNRGTKSHRDKGSRFEYMDILTSVGEFEEWYMHLESLGIGMELVPRSLVALCGATLLHQVDPGEGDRVCFAWYMRNSVLASYDITAAPWMNVDTYERFVC